MTDDTTAASADDPFDNLSVQTGQTGDYSRVSEFTMERDDRRAAATATPAEESKIDEETAEEAEGIDTSTSMDDGATVSTKQEQLKEKAKEVVGKARQASSAAIQSVVTYEQEHHIVERVMTKAQQSARFVAEKVKECTAKDTTGGAGDGDNMDTSGDK